MAGSSKRANRRAKQSAVWDAEVLVEHVWGTLDLVVFKVILGHSMHLTCNSKMNGRGAKRITIYDPVGTCRTCNAFEVLLLKVILVHLSQNGL